MKTFYLPLVLTVGGNVLYHVSQKSVPKAASPYLTMMLAYVVGIVVCALCAVFYPTDRPFFASLREVNWTAAAIGLGAVTVELGYLLAYRLGWNISLAPVLTSAGVALILIPVGLVAFKEQLSVLNVVGVVCCLVGLFLVMRG